MSILSSYFFTSCQVLRTLGLMFPDVLKGASKFLFFHGQPEYVHSSESFVLCIKCRTLTIDGINTNRAGSNNVKYNKKGGLCCTSAVIQQANVPHKQECYRSDEAKINDDTKVRNHRKDTNNNSNNDSHNHQDNQCDYVGNPAYFVDGCKNSRNIKRLTNASGSGKAYYSDYLKDSNDNQTIMIGNA
jgi:hypothetical protein